MIMLTLVEQAAILQAIKAVATSDPDEAVQTAADEVLELLEETRQLALKDKALLIFNDTTKTTNARTKNLNILRRLLLKHNVNITGPIGGGEGVGDG
jgi:predicted DNA-binding transcriptional regulator YafY